MIFSSHTELFGNHARAGILHGRVLSNSGTLAVTEESRPPHITPGPGLVARAKAQTKPQQSFVAAVTVRVTDQDTAPSLCEDVSIDPCRLPDEHPECSSGTSNFLEMGPERQKTFIVAETHHHGFSNRPLYTTFPRLFPDSACLVLPGPPKEPKTMAQHPKIEYRQYRVHFFGYFGGPGN